MKKGSFAISFISNDPNTAMAVANRLSSLFIEENLKIREQQASGTTEFLTNELAAAKVKLDQMETSVTQYKRRFMGVFLNREIPTSRFLTKCRIRISGSVKTSEPLRTASSLSKNN